MEIQPPKTNRSRISLPETNSSHLSENGWLVQMSFVFGMSHFQVRTVSFRECNHIDGAHVFPTRNKCMALFRRGGNPVMCWLSQFYLIEVSSPRLAGCTVLKDEWKSQDGFSMVQ